MRRVYTPFAILALPALFAAIVWGEPFLWGAFVGLLLGGFRIEVTS